MPDNGVGESGIEPRLPTAPGEAPEAAENGEVRPARTKISFGQLAAMSVADLRKMAKEMGVGGASSMRKDDLVVSLLGAQAERQGYRFGGGTLEILAEGYGFLRPSGLLPSLNDIYLSASQIRRFGLRNGDVVFVVVRPPRSRSTTRRCSGSRRSTSPIPRRPADGPSSRPWSRSSRTGSSSSSSRRPTWRPAWWISSPPSEKGSGP
jgi:hypothetical protein